MEQEPFLESKRQPLIIAQCSEKENCEKWAYSFGAVHKAYQQFTYNPPPPQKKKKKPTDNSLDPKFFFW